MVKPEIIKASSSIEKVLGGRIQKLECPSSNLNATDVIDAVNSEQIHRTPYTRKTKYKYAILMGYQGKNYFGMQMQQNPNHPTIEFHVLNAMHKAGLITDDERKVQSKIFFQRAARTDRGVSAVRQVCSAQLTADKTNVESDNFVKNGPDILNEHLPSDIRILAIRRATPTFHSQKSCDSRTYSYTLPTFSFAENDKLTNSSYRITSDKITEINDVLSLYKGTHNFYNYTSKKAHCDHSCKRYIIRFECDQPFLYKDSIRNEDVEFINIYIKGQSFMMHQIRKMIGMSIAVVRGLVEKSDIQKTFENKRMDVPKAPGLGLLLEQVNYDWYDRKFSKTHSCLNTWGEELETRIQNFRNEFIMNEILKTECQSNNMIMWLTTLLNHDFDAISEDEQDTSKSELKNSPDTDTETADQKDDDIAVVKTESEILENADQIKIEK